MNLEEIIRKVSESDKFKELVEEAVVDTLAEQEAEHISNAREIRRARMMEPLRDEGEWLLTSEPAGDD